MKDVTVFWYSQTGHSFTAAQKAADFLKACSFKANTLPLDSWSGQEPLPELSIFVFPVFNFGPPPRVEAFLDRLPRQESPKKALAIITYAGMPANTPWLFYKAMERKNVRVTHTHLLRCVDSYIPFAKWFSIINRTDLPDAQSFAQMEAFLEDALMAGMPERKPGFNPLNPCHWLGKASPDNGTKMFLGKRHLREEDCVKCGFCSTLCPTGAIEMSDGNITQDESLCQGCCGCINVCPKNAWRLSGFSTDYYNKGLNVARMVKEKGGNLLQ